jgi:hypothetical protein
LGEMQCRSGVVANGDVGNRAPRLFNIRTKFARTFGQPAGSVGGPESPDFLGDRGSGLGTNDGNHHKPSLIMAETNAGPLRVQRS